VQITTKLRGFGFKETLRHADLGLEVALESPRGNFVLPEDKSQSIVFLGGGIGITPFRSMMRQATDEGLPTPITLLYSAQVPEVIVFRQEFERLPQENPHLKIITTVTSPEKGKEPWMGETGLIDAAKIRAHVDDISSAIFYTCGPPPMVQAMQDLLREMNIAGDHIRVERFTGY
jgi:ferredoxin-NADP reductase